MIFFIVIIAVAVSVGADVVIFLNVTRLTHFKCKNFTTYTHKFTNFSPCFNDGKKKFRLLNTLKH